MFLTRQADGLGTVYLPFKLTEKYLNAKPGVAMVVAGKTKLRHVQCAGLE